MRLYVRTAIHSACLSRRRLGLDALLLDGKPSPPGRLAEDRPPSVREEDGRDDEGKGGRIPDSPTQSVAPAPVVAVSKGLDMPFQAACNTTAGQTLPDSSRSAR